MTTVDQTNATAERLDREWDVDRIFEAVAAGTGLTGLTLAVANDRRWLAIPAAAAGITLAHAVFGPEMTLPLFRRLGARTRDEIERERYAVEARRGEFAPVEERQGTARAEAAWRAVHDSGRETLQADRVRAHTPETINQDIDRSSESTVRAYALRDDAEIGRRIEQLNGEWDMERVLQANAGVAALAGIVLGAAVNKRWLALSGVVFGFFLQHAVQGWCPPVPVFRRLGVRTRREIDQEKYALTVLRGDFPPPTPPAQR